MPESTPKLRVRPAKPDDVSFILSMIKELAAYEREPDAVHSNEPSLRQYLFGMGFGRGPCAEALIGEVDGTPQAAAVYFMNFSTWSGAVGLYLEDLYVRPNARGLGIGKSLLIELASIARARGCRRMEWAVLDWNTSAQEFYKNLGAHEMSGWHVWRMDEQALQRLADTTR